MKLRVLFLAAVGLVGLGTSYALADEGHGIHATSASCQRAHLLGTISAPQTLTVTVTRSGPDNPFAAGQVVTVTIGTAGQNVRVDAGGCNTGSSLTANEAELHALSQTDTTGGHDSGEHESTAASTTTTTATTTTTTTGK